MRDEEGFVIERVDCTERTNVKTKIIVPVAIAGAMACVGAQNRSLEEPVTALPKPPVPLEAPSTAERDCTSRERNPRGARA